jgi:hypothetical protein
MMRDEADLLPISALQHLLFCERQAAERMHELMRDGITPVVAFQAKCRRCSMLTLCQPASIGRKKGQRRSAAAYADRQLAAAFEEAA